MSYEQTLCIEIPDAVNPSILKKKNRYKCDCKVENDNEEESFTNEFNKSEATTTCCGSAIGNV